MGIDQDTAEFAVQSIRRWWLEMGRPLIFVDETGPGGFGPVASLQTACDAGLLPFPMARIIDISVEAAPKQVSRLMLETHNPGNCSKVLPDLTGLSIFMYGTHPRARHPQASRTKQSRWPSATFDMKCSTDYRRILRD